MDEQDTKPGSIEEQTVKEVEEKPKFAINKFIEQICGPRSHLTEQATAIKILCAIPMVGAYEEEISKFYGYNGGKDKQLRRLFKEAIKIGIIEPSENDTFYFHVKWMDDDVEEDKRSISMVLDSMCIIGELKRAKNNDDYTYEKVDKFDRRSVWRYHMYTSFTEF
jgi:hypothetical protein